MNTIKISDAEWQVMKIIWRKHPVQAKDIIQLISQVQDWKPKTIKSLISRLVKKKAIAFKEENRIYQYFPIITEKEYLQLERKKFLEKTYNGSSLSLITAFINDSQFSKEEIEELKLLLEKNKKVDR